LDELIQVTEKASTKSEKELENSNCNLHNYESKSVDELEGLFEKK